MIIDLILERKDNNEYDSNEFYRDCMEYGEIGHGIVRALDGGTEKDVKQALCNYIDKHEYNPQIKSYINSVEWL